MNHAYRVIAMAALLLAAPALAQRADRPSVRVGDQWDFAMYWGTPSTEPNRAWRIERVTSAAIEGTEDGKPLRMTPDLGVLDSPRSSESRPEPLRFPLEVGKRWRYDTDWLYKPKGSAGTANVEVIVAGHETIRVPAGEFEAFRLEARQVMRGKSGIGSIIDGESRLTYWYAPAARAIVKSINRNPYLGTSTVELVAFTLQP